jgi:hypothetical protein
MKKKNRERQSKYTIENFYLLIVLFVCTEKWMKENIKSLKTKKKRDKLIESISETIYSRQFPKCRH